MISYVWLALLVLSAATGILTGRIGEVSAAVTAGAGDAVTLCISIAGIMSLWSGLMELMEASGLANRIARILSPLLRPLFGRAGRDEAAMQAVSANVTANLLGLSNAATPIGLRAAERIYAVCGGTGSPDEVLTLVVLNSASIQLIPSTVAAVRASFGCAQPFDIMPAVWGASILSVIVVLVSARLFALFWPS
ncbi:MAG: nucleoside recognition domain-containing protein [Butyricicoccaceae bacterium]